MPDAQPSLLAAIVESSDDAIVSKTLDGVVTSWNRAAERIFGYSSAEMVGRPITAIFPPDRVNEEAMFLERLARGERIDHYETVRLRKDGQPVDISVTLSPLRDPSGRIVGASKIARDITERKRAEALLHHQAESWRVTLSSIGDAVIATDVAGRVTFMNEVAAALTGWTLDDAKGKPLAGVFRIINEHTRHAVDDPVQRVLKEGVIVGLANHTILLARDGTERAIDDSAAPMRDAEGRLTGVVLVFRDVTERRRAQAALEEQEARFRLLADSAPVLIWMSGPDAKCVFFNKPWLDFTGRTIAAELGDGWADGVHAADRNRCLDIYLTAFHARQSFSMEYRLRRADGEYRWVLDTGIPRVEPDGRFAGYIGSCIDITEQRRAMEEIAEQREWFRVTLSSIGDGVIVAGLDRRVSFMNPIAESLTRWSQADAIGRPLTEIVRIVNEQTRRQVENPVEQVLRDGVSVGLANSTVLIRKDGSEVPIDDRAAPMRDQRGHLIGVVLVFRDIAARRASEAERAQLLSAEQAARADAERANRAKDEFLARLSHDLRTPLNSILGWARMLRQGALDPGKVQHALDVLERNAQVQAQLIEDLLDVSRIVSGKLHLDVRSIDAAAVIEDAIEVVRESAEAKGVTIETALDPGGRPLVGDPNRLQQVVWNLLSNAVRFTPAGGRVTVTLTRNGVRTLISIADTGPGIAPDLLPHIFERFRQGRPGSGGLGLGLAIVRHVVELHGGTVEAHSEAGRGATFLVSLPVGHPAAALSSSSETSAPHSVVPSLDGRRILLVEDDHDSRHLLAEIVRQYGGEVVEASTVSEALDAVERTLFDVIVSDIGLPDGDGYGLIRAIRQRPSDEGGAVPAVAVTAFARAEDRRRAMLAGFQTHVSKPVEPLELVVVVANLIDPRQRRG